MGLRILQPWLQPREDAGPVQLFGRPHITVGHGQIGRLARREPEGQPADLRFHVIQAGGLRVEGHQLRVLDEDQPGVELLSAVRIVS